MRRINLIRHVKQFGCVFVREGGNHSVFFNPTTNRVSTMPRHNDIPFPLIRKICSDLGIPKPITHAPVLMLVVIALTFAPMFAIADTGAGIKPGK